MLNRSTAMSKWTLRLKIPQDLPSVGKFSDGLDLTKATPPVKMYFRNEVLMEDEEKLEDLNSRKDSDFYKKRKGRRYKYREKNTIVVEDSVSQEVRTVPKLRYEGRIEGTNTNALLYDSSLHEAPFQYALLEFVKAENAVHVIPVENYYFFQKHSLSANETMEDVQEKIEKRIDQEKAKLAKFREIEKALKEKLPNEEGPNSQPTSFASNSLFTGKGQKRVKGFQLENGVFGMLDDNGRDLDELKQDGETFFGDYAATFADDDEKDLQFEQEQLNSMEEYNANKSNRYKEDGDDDGLKGGGGGGGGEEGFEVESDDDDESEPGAEDGDAAGQGLVDETMERSAKEAMKFFTAASATAARPAVKPLVGEENERLNLKRLRGDNDLSVLPGADTQRKGVKFSEEVVMESVTGEVTWAAVRSDEKIAKKPRVSVAGKAGIGAGAEEYELTEASVRKYITVRGGAVRIDEVKEVFADAKKKYAKQMNDKKAGTERLLQILLKITNTVDHELLGKALVLKA